MFFSKKSFRIEKKVNEIEPEEIFLDSFIKKKEKELSSYQFESPLKFQRILICVLILAFVFFLFFLKTTSLQIFAKKEFQQMAQKNQFLVYSIQSHRGIIYDRNFSALVSNKPSFDLICKKTALEDEKTKEKLEQLFNLKTQESIREEQKLNNDSILLKENLEYGEIILFEGLQEEFKDCYIQKNEVREYYQGKIFAHVLGYWNKNGSSAGLENFYDQVLSSEKGKVLIERDAKGNIISEKIEEFPKPGRSLVLWLDKDLQEVLYHELEKKLNELGLYRGIGVAIDPKTGGILAMVSFPSYDNNLFSQGISQQDWEKIQNDLNHPLLNRVISGKYPTGSTIKPLVAAAALQEKIITDQTTVNCQGQIEIENPYNKDKPYIFKDWKRHGIVNVKKAIAESCNVFFYTVGGGYKNFKGLGVDLINKYLSLFGWKEKLGIDLPGEVAGFVPSKEWKKENFDPPLNIWFPGDTYNLSIGQGYLRVTPLEVVTSFAAVANGGKLLRPKLGKAIVDEKKNIIEEFLPEVIREDFIDKKNLEIVKEGMREAVIYGSATILSDLPVKAAAKTGTAQTGKENRYHNWVTVFAPYEDPQIVLTIMIEDVPGLQVASLSVAKNVLNWYFSK